MIPNLEELLRRLAGATDGTHDVDHVARVWRLCEGIVAADAMVVDRDVLMAAAYLHDLVVHPKDSAERGESSTESAHAAVALLRLERFPDEKLCGVHHAIVAHSFSASVEPKTDEARVLQDADRIEALGSIGVARTFYTGGCHKARLFHPDDPLARRRKPDEFAFVLDHLGIRAFGLVDRMHTPAGREIGASRLRLLKSFVLQLLEEAGQTKVLGEHGELRFGP